MCEQQPRGRARERGSVSIEMALVTPIVVLIIMGGVHVGLSLSTKHKLADATAFAARQAAVVGQRDAATIRAIVEQRLGAETLNDCQSPLEVQASIINGAANGQTLLVRTTCRLTGWFNNAALGLPFAPESVSSRAAFPIPIDNER